MTNGDIVVRAMNALHYDAMALGPYELGLGRDTLSIRLESAEFPVVSANAYWAGGGRIVEPYVIVPVAGHPIAVVGLTREPEKAIDGIEVRDPRSELEAVLPELESRATTVIVLANLEFDDAESVVADLGGVDLLVAGLPFPALDHAKRIEPGNAIGVSAETPTAGHTGRHVGRLAVTVAADGTLSDEAWSTVNLDKTFADDPAMNDLLVTADA